MSMSEPTFEQKKRIVCDWMDNMTPGQRGEFDYYVHARYLHHIIFKGGKQ